MVKGFESLGTNIRVQDSTVLDESKALARAQLLRYRRRLGTLTPDQELQIEEFVISTVAKFSLLMRSIMEALIENSKTKTAKTKM